MLDVYLDFGYQISKTMSIEGTNRTVNVCHYNHCNHFKKYVLLMNRSARKHIRFEMVSTLYW
jgi:hypothetical protein